MAEGSTSSSQEDLVTCALCMEIYTDPRALPCLHSFCYGCLNNLIKSALDKLQCKLKCPLCQETHMIPDNGAADFRKDFRVKAIIEHIEDKSKKPSDAQKSNTLSAKFAEEDIYTAPHVEREISSCEKHAKCPLNYYCKDDLCGKVICETCWTETHGKHNVVLLSMRMQEISKNIRSQANQYKEQLAEHLSQLVHAKEEVSSNKKSMKDAIRTHIKKNIEKLLLLNDKGVQDIEAIAAPEESNLDQEIEKLHDMKKKLSVVSENVTTLQKGKEHLHEVNRLGDEITNWKVEYKLSVLKLNPLSIDNNSVKVDFGTHALGVKDDYVEEPPKVPLRKNATEETQTMNDTINPILTNTAKNTTTSKPKAMQEARKPCSNKGTDNLRATKKISSNNSAKPVESESDSDSEPNFNRLFSQTPASEDILRALLGLDDFDICQAPTQRIVFCSSDDPDQGPAFFIQERTGGASSGRPRKY